jgi:pSer/pThr/pTyr-binding forkhead associated (FHA) protein
MSEPRFFLKKLAGGSEVEITTDLSVGRSPENGLKLTEGNPSRNHARFTLAPDGVYVEDLKSTNGTYINGTRIEKRTRVFAKDKVRFDTEEYILRVEAPPDPPDTDADATKMRPQSEVAEGNGALRPRWIDGDNNTDGANKTVFKSAEELRREHEEAARQRQSEGQTGPVTVPQLRIYDGAQPRVVQLLTSDPSKREWSVGSDEGREIRIQREGVSGLHAKIINAGKVWKVVDQVAANGTFVNGERVNMRYLNSGDRIDFGPVESVFEAPGLAATARGKSDDAATPDTAARRKRGLIIAGLSFLATLIVLLIVLKFL